MKAVNLIPTEDRRGGAGSPGRAGNAVYILLGVLAALVLAAGAYALTGRTVTKRTAELANKTAEADAAEAQAGTLKSYADFSSLKQKRVETVRSLAESRFDWERVMDDLARVIPKNVWLTSFVGTVSPSVGIEGGGSGGASQRGLLPVPAVEIIGCATSQTEVARMLVRMRLIDGVTRVTLSSSEKSDSPAGGGGGAADGGTGSDCRNGSRKFPMFSLVVFFGDSRAVPGGATPTAAPAAAAPNGAATGAAAGAANGDQSGGSSSSAPASGDQSQAGQSAQAGQGTTPGQTAPAGSTAPAGAGASAASTSTGAPK